MNEPDKKAQELYDFYFPLVAAYTVEGQHENAKNAAIKVADELIGNTFLSMQDYWVRVKESLNKLKL